MRLRLPMCGRHQVPELAMEESDDEWVLSPTSDGSALYVLGEGSRSSSQNKTDEHS